MATLSHKDTFALLESINILHSDISPETLQERTIRAVELLFPSSSMTAFDGFDTEGDYTGYFWYSPPGTVSEERVAILGELVHEHPYHLDAIRVLRESTFRTSDYISLRDFHRTELYNEFYRTFDGEAQMGCAMRISPSCLLTCSVHRPKADFSDGDVEMLRLLTPHLKSAFHNARELENLVRAKNGLSRVAKKGIAILDTDRKVTFISELAIQLLKNYFPNFKNDELPAEIRDFVEYQNRRLQSRAYFEPADTLRVRQGDSELQIRLAFDFTARELTLFMEEKIGFSQNDLLPLGLTRRETEILFWLCRGKTDAVIGQLCGISVRTVQKHVENIFAKLGVETRAGAVAAAYERTR